MPLEFLLALQASGMVVDWFGKQEQVRLGKMGAEVEQAGIQSNIATARLQAEDESLQSLKQLRMNLGSQAANAAARGVSNASTTNVLNMNSSVGNWKADERARKINLAGTEAALNAGKLLSELHEKTAEQTIWNQFRSDVIKKIPTSTSAYSSAASSFGLSKVGS